MQSKETMQGAESIGVGPEVAAERLESFQRFVGDRLDLLAEVDL